MGIENRVNTLFRILMFALLALNCRAAIVPIQETVFTTNTFDTDIVGGAIPYFDFPSGKFVASPTAYSNALFYDPALGFLSIVHTNDTGDLLLNLAVASPSGPSIQAYADKLVVANTNLTFDAVGPFSIRLRVDGSNIVDATQNEVALNRLLTLSGMPLGIQLFFYNHPNTALAYITNIYSKNISAGDTNILTVPSGYRFLLFRALVVPTNTAIASSWISVLTNGVTTRLRQATAVPTNGSVLSTGFGNNFVFEQNETLVVHTATNLQRTDISGLIFTNSIPLKSYRNLALSGGDNTLYTVPANTIAVAYVPPGGFLQHNIEYFNGTAGSVTNGFYLIPSGDSKNINTKLSTTVAATLINGGTSLNPILFAGDSILLELSSSAAGQVAWLTVWEQ